MKRGFASSFIFLTFILVFLFSNKVTAEIGKLPIYNIETYGKKPTSRFLISGYTLIPEDESQTIAEMYIPYFVKAFIKYPDKIYYCVIMGYDPYTDINNSYIILYYPYFSSQKFIPPHRNDYEPIYVWVRNIGERLYKIAFDELRLLSSSVRPTFCRNTY